VAREVGRARAQLSVSLHQVQLNRWYRVLASKTPCTRVHTEAARVLSVDTRATRSIANAAGTRPEFPEWDFLEYLRVPRREDLSRVRSVRIYDWPGQYLRSRARQVACSVTVTGESGATAN
jgi:hypothetical protein